MINDKIRTCEFVSPKHPDKICDFIADSILDAYFAQDKNSRCAIEVMGGHNLVTVTGEVTSKGRVNIEKLVKDIVGKNFEVKVKLAKQSEEIAHGVDMGGAGDQGIMIGYATNETRSMMPFEYELARNLCQKIYAKHPYNGKVQVTLRQVFDSKAQTQGAQDKTLNIDTVVVSFQNTKSAELEEFVKNIIKSDEYFINPAGEWTLGSFDVDSGLSGRKIVIDSYGPNVPVGGGSFSGKDLTKVDRSGAYIARKIAVDLLKKNEVSEVLVKLAYAIGKSESVMAQAIIDGEEEKLEGYNLAPRNIIKELNIKKFAPLSQWGHF